jgi:shikimate kinase
VSSLKKQLCCPLPLYFCGIKHSGKSTLGRLTASRLGLHFYDSDELVLAYLHEKGQGGGFRTVRELYRTRGPEAFMEAEFAAAAELLARYEGGERQGSFLLALGGGFSDNFPLVRLITAGTGTVCYIVQDERILLERIMRGGIPPFLDSDDPAGSFGALFRKRDAACRKAADLLLDISGDQPAAASVAMILDRLTAAERQEEL